MKCSMTCKRLLVLCLGVCMALALSGHALAAEEEPFLPDGSGSLLLVHSRNLSQEQTRQVERLVMLASALGKTVDYGTAEQCRDVLGEYPYVILYDLPEMTRGFGTALKKSGAQLMLIGSGTLRRYLTLVGQSGKILEEEPQENGKMTYTFPTGGEYACITHWKGLFRFQAGEYQSGSLQAGGSSYPFCAEVAQVRFVPVTDLSQTLVRAALMQEITQWMWPYQDNPTDYAQFLVLDSVYPFMPAQQLLDIVEQVETYSVPYVISVMPLSANTDYPAMTQFCQVLAYAQSRGATIVLHAPILHKTVETAEELYEKLTDMTNAYIRNGVYPLGIQVPYSWLNREPYLTVLGRYRTVLTYDDGNPTFFDPEAHTSRISRQGHQLIYPRIDLDQNGVSQLQCYPSATYVDCGSASQVFLRYARAARTQGDSFMDLRDYNHQVWLNGGHLEYQNRTVYLDGTPMDTTFHPVEYDTDYDFQRSPLVRMSVDLKNQNRFLLTVVAVMVAVFLYAIVYARRRMRKRFLSGGTREEEQANDTD